MDKTTFVRIIIDYLIYRNRIAEISNNLGLDLMDSNIVSYTDKLFNEYLKSNFNPESTDTIIWWCIDKQSNPELTYKVDGKLVPSDTINDLWNIVEKYRK